MAMRKMLILSLLTAFLFAGCGSQKVEYKRSKADIYYSHGTSKLLKKKYTEALGLLLQAERERPNDSKIHNNLGMAYFFKKKPELAIYNFKKAIEIDSKNSDAKNNLASLYFKRGQYTQAKSLYQQVSQDLVYRHQYRVQYNLGLIALKEGNAVTALSHLQQAVDEKDDYCPAQFKLGEISERRRNFTAAYSHYKKATLGTCVSLPAPHYHQALTLLKLNRIPEARAKLENIIEKFSTSRYSLLATNKLNEIKNSGKTELTRESILRDYEKRKKNIESYDSTSF